MIWGMTLHPGVEYSREVTKEEHLTLASLDCRPKMVQGIYHPMAHLVVKVNNCEHVLCYLEKGITHQQSLDFIFQKGDNLVLTAEGTSVMHISGYTVRPSISAPEVVQYDGRLQSPVKPDPNEAEDDSDSTISSDLDLPEIFDETSVEKTSSDIQVVSLHKQISKVEKDDDEDSDLKDCEMVEEDTVVCEDNEEATSSLQISAEDLEMLLRAKRTEIDLNNQELQKTLRVVLTNAKREKFRTEYGRKEITYRIDDDAEINKTGSNSVSQEKEQDECSWSSVTNSQPPSLEKQINKEPVQEEGDQTHCQDLKCEDIIDRLILGGNSEGIDFQSQKPAASSSDFLQSNDMEKFLETSDSQDTSVQVADDCGKEHSNYLKPNAPSVDSCNKTSLDTPERDSNHGVEVSGADDIPYNVLPSDYDTEEHIPGTKDATHRKAQQQSGQGRSEDTVSCDRLLIKYSQYPETSTGANDDNDWEAVVGKLEKSGVKSPEIEKSCDSLLRCDTGKEITPSSFNTNRVPKSIKKSLRSPGVKTALDPQQDKRTEPTTLEKDTAEDEKMSTDGNQYKCTLCEKTFRRKVKLINHQKTHMVPNMQRCQTGSNFISGEDLLLCEGKTTCDGYVQCKFCQSKPINPSVKQNHLHIRVSRGRVFKCHICKMMCSSKRGLIIHKLKHNVKKKFLCQFCGKAFTQKQTLQAHERIHNSKGSFKCKFCAKLFVQRIQFVLHEKKCHNTKSSEQGLNSQQNKEKERILKNTSNHSCKRPFKCQFCSKRFLSKTHVSEHERIHTGEKPFQCQVCGKRFAAKGNANKHENTVHASVKPNNYQLSLRKRNNRHQSEMCEKTRIKETQDDSLLNNHLSQNEKGSIIQDKVINKEVPLKRSFCKKTIVTKSPVLQHERVVHAVERSFMCQFCGKGFFTRQHVLRHEKIHTSKKPFKCRFCAKAFILKQLAIAHERMHTGERSFQSQVCAQKFNSESHLKIHLKCHENEEKKYKCRFCSRGFKLNCNKIIHERIHTNERPYKCSFCPKRFIQKNHVVTHERLHTNERPFKCSICGYGFIQKAGLLRHERVHKHIANETKV